MTLSAIIVEDERLARLTLRRDLEKFSEIQILGEAPTIVSAQTLIEQTNPDVLFLDIQLADGNGFDLLNQIDFAGRVIFITAFNEYALRAFEINALDYLLKPISVKRLKKAIERLTNNELSNSNIPQPKLNYDDQLMVMHKKSINFIKIDKIISINASREYSYIHTLIGREYLSSKSIGDWESRLPDQNFCRIHRSTIINFEYISRIDPNQAGSAEVIMQGKSEPLKISRNYFRRLKGRYSI